MLAAATLLVSRALRDGAPVADGFYDAPAAGFPQTPGQLVRWQPYDGDLPDGMTGYRLLYVTTDADGAAVLASAALAVPEEATAPAPLITWAHGTVGVARGCAPTIGEGEGRAVLDVVGTAALSPASDPEALAETVLAHPDALGASLAVAFVADAYTRYYDDLELDRVVAPSARTIVREAAARCTGQGGTLVTVLAGLAIARDQPIVRDGALDGPFGERLRQNVPGGPWGAPLFIAQGEADEVIPFSITEEYVAGLCRDGVHVEFAGYPGGSHMSILETGSALSVRLEEWTTARLAGLPTGDGCG